MRVFSATLIVSAVALIGLSWDDIWRVCQGAPGTSGRSVPCSHSGDLHRSEDPGFTCNRGHFDDALAVCMHPLSISDATSWLLLKEAIVVIGLLGGVAVAVRPRNIRVTAPVSVAVWGAGFGWLIIDTVA